MRDLETLLQTLDRKGFTEHEHVDNLPSLPFDDDNAGMYVADGFLVHGTTVESAARILDDGLLPRSGSLCEIWADDRIPDFPDKNVKMSLLECRNDNVYFWDKYSDAMGQAVGSVEYLGAGNPAFLLVDVDGLKTELDDEINPVGLLPDHSDGEGIAYRHEGPVDRNRVRCVCFLQEKYYPTLGEIMCAEGFTKNKYCPWEDRDAIREQLEDTDSWRCRCRANMKAPKQALLEGFE
jgi:hypothetical protein